MIIGIDASNIRAGGGITHLVELLRASDPMAYGFERVIVWGGTVTLAKIEDRAWLRKIHVPLLDRGLLCRVFWQRFGLKRLALQAECDALFVPGGIFISSFKPIVTMSQNLLPFEWSEMRQFGWSLYTLKFLLIRWVQVLSFRNADGVIFLTRYARDAVLNVTGALRGKSTIIPHGINPRFFREPRPQRLAREFNFLQPCRVLYVSSVDVYKHQCQVVEAVSQLRSDFFPVVLELVGPPATEISRLREALNRVDPEGAFIRYCGAIPYEELDEFYGNADIGVFASSCETFGQILTEKMSAGLPIACSNRSAMSEILGEAGVYFDPENVEEINNALRELINSSEMRIRLAQGAYWRARRYSWKRCANETFVFFAEIAHRQKEVFPRV